MFLRLRVSESGNYYYYYDDHYYYHYYYYFYYYYYYYCGAETASANASTSALP